MANWVIIGAGNFLGDIIDAVESRGDKVPCIVLNMETSAETYGIKTVALDDYKAKKYTQHIFGFLNPNKNKLLDQLGDLNFDNLIHEHAYVPKSACLGKGNYIGPGAVIGPNVKIGDFNYINRCASLGHNTVLGSFIHVGPGATICGRCQIGSKSYIGANATVRDGVSLTDGIILGMASAAVKNLEIPGTYIGVPAKARITETL